MEKEEVLLFDLLRVAYEELLEQRKDNNILFEDVVYHLLMNVYNKVPEMLDVVKKYCVDISTNIYIYEVKAKDFFAILNDENVDIEDQLKDYKLIDIPYIDEDTVCIRYYDENDYLRLRAIAECTSKQKSKNKAAFAVLKSMGTVTEKIGLTKIGGK